MTNTAAAEHVSSATAARLLLLTESRVRQLADAGVLPVAFLMNGKTRVFRRVDVEALAARRAEMVGGK